MYAHERKNKKIKERCWPEQGTIVDTNNSARVKFSDFDERSVPPLYYYYYYYFVWRLLKFVLILTVRSCSVTLVATPVSAATVTSASD